MYELKNDLIPLFISYLSDNFSKNHESRLLVPNRVPSDIEIKRIRLLGRFITSQGGRHDDDKANVNIEKEGDVMVCDYISGFREWILKN